MRPLFFLTTLLAVPTLVMAADLSPTCKPVFTAMEKTIAADHNTTTTRDASTSHGVTVAGAMYIQLRGAWRKSPLTPQAVIAQSHENLRNAKEYTCSTLADSVVNGTPVSNYATRTVGSDATVDSTVSISRSSGLAVQVENDMRGDNTGHYVTRYDYSNVKPPM